MKKLFLIFLLMFVTTPVWGAIVSPDYTFVANDVYSSDFHTRLNRDITQLTIGINNVESVNIANDTLAEADMADEINPRIRTYESAYCEKISGLLPTTSGSLSTNFPTGTAYPLGYRIVKNSATAHTYTANRWTWTYIDQNGDFQYQEVAIGGATPSTPANSIVIARVSTDATTVAAVTDLRLTNCVTGLFEEVNHSATGAEPNLHDMFLNGIPVTSANARKAGTAGWIQGLGLRYLNTTSFTVMSGSAYINGVYKVVSSDVTVPSTEDDPTGGTSGIISGSPAASTDYNVWAVGDVAGSKVLSISYGTSPTGLTNYRYIGQLHTGPGGFFSQDSMLSAYSNSENELVACWVNFDGSTTPLTYRDGFNVTALTDNGLGNYTITWGIDFSDANYVLAAMEGDTGANADRFFGVEAIAAGTVTINCYTHGGVDQDAPYALVTAVGD